MQPFPFSFWKSGYYDPALNLALTGFWRAGDYDAAAGTPTWTRTPSLGTSGEVGRDLVNATGVFATDGAVLNGRKTVRYAGTSAFKASAAGKLPLSNYVNADAKTFTVSTLVYLTAISTDQAACGNGFLNDGVVCDSAGFWGLHLRSTGPRAEAYIFPNCVQQVLASLLNTWVALQFRQSAADNCQIGINGTFTDAGFITAIGSLAAGNELRVGGGTNFIDGDMADVFIADQYLPDLVLVDQIIGSYYPGRYGVSL